MADQIEVTMKDNNKSGWFFELIKIVIVPLTIAFVSIYYTNVQKDSEINLKYIELAIDILKQPNSDSNQYLKEYAKDIIKKYSEVPLSKKAEEEIQKIDFFLNKYELDIEKMIDGNWEVIKSITINDLDKLAPIPSKNIRWHIKYPKNVIFDEKQYELFVGQKADKTILEYLNEKRKEHHEKYNMLDE